MSPNPSRVHQRAADPWAALDAEFDAWGATGRTADLWWRDDDAAAPGAELERLFDTTVATGLLLAVIPARAKAGLERAVAAHPHVRVAQHGYAHVNHAPRGKGLGAWELGLHRGEAAVLADLDAGRERLESLFGERYLPVVVPPWNRIDPALAVLLAARGYRGISAFGPRTVGEPAPGLMHANAQCDLLRWKEGPRFVGEAKGLGILVGHLEARRNGAADPDEPLGLLTHHLNLDEAGWAFCARLAETVARHPAARWRGPTDVFGGNS